MTAGQPGPAARLCPSCGQPVWPQDNFCEACRADLSDAGACSFCPSGTIGPDGYCESCGRKPPSPRDHAEANLGFLAGVTDRGLRHHRNEDAMALAAIQAPGGATVIAVVCDGVSSSPRPDEASQAATTAALPVLLSAVRSGADAVAGLSGPPGADGPSATFLSAVITAQAVTVCWLGDSRAYWLDAAGSARRLTTDDSLASQMVSGGLLGEAEAMASPEAHVLTRWLGPDSGEFEPHVSSFAPPGPGLVLLCTDGLWNYRPQARDLAAMALPAGLSRPLEAARALVGFALAEGGRDNVSVVLAPFPPSGPVDPARTYPDDLREGPAAAKENRDE